MFFFRPDYAPYIMVRIAEGQELETLQRLETLYEKRNPDHPFDPTFLDQDYQAQYVTEERLAQLSRLFAGLTILISCLGLFGLVIFNVKRKTKEIGIKKVLGCNSSKLAISLTYGFTRPVFLSLFIALPLSYLMSMKWLETFAYRIELSWWMFAIAALLAILISWLTVGTQTLKAAQANPVDALRNE